PLYPLLSLNATAPPQLATRSLHDALPILDLNAARTVLGTYNEVWNANRDGLPADATSPELRDQFLRSYPLHPKLLEMLTEKTARSEEHTSELQSPDHLVCRLLLEKKK